MRSFNPIPFVGIFLAIAATTCSSDPLQNADFETSSPSRARAPLSTDAFTGTEPPSDMSSLTELEPRTGLYKAVDLNEDPAIIEVVLVAKPAQIELIPGIQTDMWTYNGVFPGPQIMGNVGDTVVVHLFNELPVETTIHWHGVEIDAAMDGSPITQLPVQPGEYFRYEFKMRHPAFYWYHPHIRTDKQIEAGLQAPLVMRDSSQYSKLGIPPAREKTFVLDDILLVRDPADPEYGELYDFALDDDFLNEPEHTPAERAELIFNARDREDGVLLVNGRGALEPESNPDDLPTVHVTYGVPERWRFVNTATGRFMRVSIAGQVLHQIATDGGLLEHPIARQPIDKIPNPEDPGQLISNPDPDLGIFLSPAERAEVVYVPQGSPGEVKYLEWHDYPRGRHIVVSPGETLPNGTLCEGPAPCFQDHPNDGERPPKPILRIVIQKKNPAPPAYNVPQDLTDIEDIRDQVNASDLDEALPVTFGHMPPDVNGLITFFAAVQDSMQLHEDIRGEDVPVAPAMYGPAPTSFVMANPEYALWAEHGSLRYWDVVNFTGNDHPLHTHGFFFQPIHTRYVDLEDPSATRTEPFGYVALKDTIRVPKRPGSMATSWTVTRMAVQFDDSRLPPALRRTAEQIIAYGGDPTVRPGGWVDHCHIDHHAESGMLTFLNVVPVGYPIPSF